MTLFFRLTDFPRATARGIKCYPSTFRQRGAILTSGRSACLPDFRTRLTGTWGKGFHTTETVQQRVGLWHFLCSNVVYQLHHTKLFLLIKLKTQNLHQNLFGKTQRFCKSGRWYISEPEFWKHNFVSYGDLSFLCSGTILLGDNHFSLSSISIIAKAWQKSIDLVLYVYKKMNRLLFSDAFYFFLSWLLFFKNFWKYFLRGKEKLHYDWIWRILLWRKILH